jgi:hypothetical protein
VIFVDNDGQFENALGQKEAFEQRNESPEYVTRILTQLSRTSHHENDEAIQNHPNCDYRDAEAFLYYGYFLPHVGKIKCFPKGIVGRAG